MSKYGARVTDSVASVITRDPFLYGLLFVLRGRHELNEQFEVSDSNSRVFGWSLYQLRESRRRAVAAGWLVQVSPPRRSRPARYVFGLRCWTDLPDAKQDDWNAWSSEALGDPVGIQMVGGAA